MNILDRAKEYAAQAASRALEAAQAAAAGADGRAMILAGSAVQGANGYGTSAVTMPDGQEAAEAAEAARTEAVETLAVQACAAVALVAWDGGKKELDEGRMVSGLVAAVDASSHKIRPSALQGLVRQHSEDLKASLIGGRKFLMSILEKAKGTPAAPILAEVAAATLSGGPDAPSSEVVEALKGVLL